MNRKPMIVCSGGRKIAAGVAATLALALMLPAVAASAATAGGHLTPARLRPLPPQQPVPVHAVPSHKVKVPVMHAWQRPRVSWPAAGTATAALPAGQLPSGAKAAAMAAPTPGSARAGTLPVWIGPAAGTTAVAGAASPAAGSRVRVTMASRQSAAAAGVSGVIFTLSPASPAAAGRVHVSLDYSSFAFAYGGGYAARLRLVELPSCALTTPKIAACRSQVPLASADNVRDFRLGVDVALPAVWHVVPGTIVLASTTSPSGSAGDYSATPLSEAGTWTQGGSSGAFTYSYPIQVPPVPAGLAPQVSLGYNSQAVDGLTSSTNDQASWIGDGWDYSPGYIERDYASCETQPPGATNWSKSGDLCWSSNDVTTLSLGGVTTTLVDDPTKGWHAEADNGYQVSYDTGAGNLSKDGGYWVVTAPDGTSYYFGEDELPGWVSGDASAASSYNVPVYSYETGDPCYDATAADAHCYLPWRWNLDYVTDSHGDAMAMFYKTETNYYAEDNGTTGSAAYTQGGALSEIEYGLRAGDVYGSTAGTLTTPAAKVTFTTSSDRTDIPSDLACSSGASCDVISPTFWTKDRLTTIATSTNEGGTMEPVDSWALAQDYADTGDGSVPPPLWLESVTRTGEDGGSAPPLKPVTFSGISLPNRVMTPTDLQDGYSIIDRNRLSSVTSETGGVTTITYDTPPSSCTSGNFPAEDANTTLCYPDWWTPSKTAIEDWFNKYVVTRVRQSNTAGGVISVDTNYSYSGAAWHYDDDSLTRSSQRTWDQWRGFASVTSQTGNAADGDPVTEGTDTYFQGMNGDYQGPGNAATSASLTSTVGGVTVTDSDQFAGMDFEHTVYDGAGGPIVADTVATPWTSAATATQSSPLPALTAYMTGTAKQRTYTALASGGYREAYASYAHDSDGRITSEADAPDISDNGAAGDPSEDTCTQTTYASNSSNTLLDLPKEVIVTSVAPASCPISGTPTFAELVSDTQYLYDGATSITSDTLSAGNVTETLKAVTSYSGTSEVFTPESKESYDEYGRVTSSTNADGIADGYLATKTVYTPATGAEATSVSVTDPLGLVTTTTYDPARDLPLTVTNPAGWVTTEKYDPLGRLTAVWTQGHPTTGPADKTFSYDPSNSAPSVVTTETINASGSYLTSETLYDSLGRQIETQTETPDGSRDITDTDYNSDGWVQKVSNPYNAAGAPSATLVAAPDGEVPSQTGYVYDGDGRVIRQITYEDATEQWETDTSYGGDCTTVTPPAGGTAQTTYTNGDGLTSYIYQYHAASPPATPPLPGSGSQSGTSGWDQTAYTYSPAGQLLTITDDAAHQWSYLYDPAGDQTSATTPDTGTTTSTYDLDGNVLSVTTERGDPAKNVTTSYTYDADDRKTFEYDTTGGGAESGPDERGHWIYDSAAKGELTASVSYPTGTGGTSYTNAVSGYNGLGLPEGNTVTISGGTFDGSYSEGYGYTTYGNLLSEIDYSAAAGLPQEELSLGYDNANEPVSLTSSLWDYVSGVSYTELGQPQEYALGTTDSPAWIIDTYDPVTGKLATSGAQAGASPVTLDGTTYGYDNAGLITSEQDYPGSGPAQVQCFTYDYLGRLTNAWSQGTSGCSAGPSQSAEAGTAAPYWEQYTYNDENDFTGETSTPATGPATTISTQYTASPHQITSLQSTTGSSSTTTSYSYDPAGDTTSVATTSPANTQDLTWNDAGQLAQVQSSGGPDPGTTSYVYDADGNLLVQSDPGSSTLYLPGEDLTVTTSGGTTTDSGTRYYTIGGVTVASRTSDGQVDYLDGNQQGTSTLAINYSTLAPTYRFYDPYGNPIGTAPSSWPGTEGFVGGTADPATGLDNLGVREYTPASSAFVSPDPLLNPDNPQDLNPYAYASDDPSTEEDPSGLCATLGVGEPPINCNRQPISSPGGGTGQTGCPDYLPGCPGFTGGGADQGGETLYGPGYGGRSSVVNLPSVIRDIVAEITDLGTDTQVTPVGYQGPEILITPEGDDLGPEILINVPAQLGPETLINVPGYQGPIINPASSGVGQDRGDGRDVLGRFTGAGGYGADQEAQGLLDYQAVTGRTVIYDKVRAVLPDGSIRYYDGLTENPDGTYTGIEVKGGSGGRNPSQRAFDGGVNNGTPAIATLNGQSIEITSAIQVNVP